ncbi:MOSC domain-containing protein [Pseudomonas aeruginosa]|uniref:MOSC domain-containing protein n=1 Tax=Pseudomonas aeruginosa TaxID=287 RepID=UPI001EDE2FC7|nr:MOSC domain-containing protein [Pseudomonas aeruginosa]
MQQVIAVSLCATHAFSKQVRPAIRLLKGLGVEGDAHHGVTVKHRSRVRQDPTQPNLRQVHLIHEELHDELRASGFAIGPGTMGENITTRGVDLLGLPTGTRLRLGESALVELTGLRNPCSQLDNYQPGLTAAVLGRDEQGNLIRKAGVMAIVLEDGEVRPATPSISSCPLAAPGPGEGLRQSAAIPGELCARACVPMLASTAQPQGVTACTSSHWRHCS